MVCESVISISDTKGVRETLSSSLYLIHTQGILPSRNLSELILRKSGISAIFGGNRFLLL